MSHVSRELFGFHLAHNSYNSSSNNRAAQGEEVLLFYEEGFSVTRNGGQGSLNIDTFFCLCLGKQFLHKERIMVPVIQQPIKPTNKRQTVFALRWSSAGGGAG